LPFKVLDMTRPTATDIDLALAKAEILNGQQKDAVTRLLGLIETTAFAPVLYYWLSAAYGALGERDLQGEILRTAQTFHSLQTVRDNGGDVQRFNDEPAYALAVAEQFLSADLMGPASLGLAKAAIGVMETGAALLAYGRALAGQGRLEEAEAALSVGAEMYNLHSAESERLSLLPQIDNGLDTYPLEALRWGAVHSRDPQTWPDFDNSRAIHRNLRIGYLTHRLGRAGHGESLVPVLEAHRASEVFVYCDDASLEAPLAGVTLRTIGNLSDAQAQALILSDHIDVLVDCDGHGAESRLLVMARKAAPVQVSWNRSGLTTGLPSVDYALVIDAIDALEDEAPLMERRWPIGPILAPYRPEPCALKAVLQRPQDGAMVFASLANPSTLDDDTIALWSMVLLTRPKATLWLKHRYMIDPVLQNATSSRFAACGVDPDRLVFRHLDDPQVLGPIHAAVDLVLAPAGVAALTDPSLLQALSDGVPVLTLAHRAGYGAPNPVEVLNLSDCVATNPRLYVEQAIRMTTDIDGLRRQSQGLPLLFAASVFADVDGFTLRLETALRQMFEGWALRNMRDEDRSIGLDGTQSRAGNGRAVA
jgi:tetratricopeptide (TPR) repeat protein